MNTGKSSPPAQHISKKTGEVIYYVRPVFKHGQTVGMFVRYQGIVDYVQGLKSKGG